MSDIYLQITETPTVVTLSAPVISGALSSTVTVANTVTVALDANSLSALENVTVTVGAGISGTVTANAFATNGDGGLVPLPVGVNGEENLSYAYPIGFASDVFKQVGDSNPLPIYGTVTIGSAMPAGTNRIGVVTIGGGTVTIGAGTAQIGSVTASISGTVPVSGTFWQATQPVSGTFWQATQPASLASLPALAAGTAQIGSVTASISGTVPVSGTFWQTTQPVALSSTTVTVSSLPALAAGTAQIGSVTASISGTVPISISSVTVGNSVTIGSCATHGVTITNTVVTFFPAQGTSVSATNFTSLTSSTTIAPAVDGREVLTVFNEGAGNLYICPGATCTTVAYQVRLSAGDYWECPGGQLSLAHTAVFATAGTARVTQVS
jgi:hypothetical protein